MTAAVVDGSVMVALLIGEPATAEMTALEFRVQRQGANVPAHFKLEVANALLTAARRGRLSSVDASSGLRDLDALHITVDDRSANEASVSVFGLAERLELSVYDAAYLELAQRLGADLATLDRKLAQAAQDEGVALVDLGAAH